MCCEATNLHGRIELLKQQHGAEVYQQFFAILAPETRFICRLLFEAEAGWMETVYLVALRVGGEDRVPDGPAIDAAQRAVFHSLATIREAMDREFPIDSGK